MSKWIIWALLELTTFLALLTLLFLWFSHSLKKKKKEAENTSTAKNASDAQELTKEEREVKNEKTFAHFLDKQIRFAAGTINPDSENHSEVNTIKLWGTLLKAERAIVLNHTSEKPKPILTRFLSSLLYALSAPKLQMANTDELNQSLKDMEEELLQTAEVLTVKESLTEKQLSLNEGLRESIDRATKRVAQLRIKQKEQQRLELELGELQKKIKGLEQNQRENPNDSNSFSMNIPSAKELDQNSRNSAASRSSSFKQISTLNSLSGRQQMVIEQLKNEIEKASKNKGSKEELEAQKVAMSKMERMSEESQTLIFQLEKELESSNFTIAALKQDISEKDLQLAEIESQLSNSNETAIGNLKTLNENKKETLDSLRDDLTTAIENHSTANLVEQEKDTKMLERLLQESETCVTLLAQELETAEAKNQELKEKVASMTSKDGNSDDLKQLQENRDKNRELVKITAELKHKIQGVASDKDYQELRVAYNKKSLEYDRLQLASSDLEMKYLGTLNK